MEQGYVRLPTGPGLGIELAEEAIANLDDPETVGMLCERGLTHVYVGQREGRVNYGGPHVLSVEEMLRSPSYRLVYQQDKVAVFEILCSVQVSRAMPPAQVEGL